MLMGSQALVYLLSVVELSGMVLRHGRLLEVLV